MTAIRVVHRGLAAAGAALAVLAAAVKTPVPAERGARIDTVATSALAASTPPVVDARQLAVWLRDGDQSVRVLDLRGDSAYESRHIPSAEPADFARLDTVAKHREVRVVLYSNDDVRDAQAWANLAARGHRDAYVLSGGMRAWEEEVMEPILRGDSADYVAALSRYFGGAPRVQDEPARRATPAVPLPARDDTASGTETVRSAARRGC